MLIRYRRTILFSMILLGLLLGSLVVGYTSWAGKGVAVTSATVPQDPRVVRPAPTSLPQAIEQIREESELLERSVITNQNFDTLTEKLQTQSEVRVIVTLRTVFNAQAEAAGNLLGQAQRLEVNRLRDQLMTTLVGYDPASIKTYEILPFVAMSVNTIGLAWLRASSLVLAIEEDLRLRRSMAQSIPMVQADQAWAAGYIGTGLTVAVLDDGVDKNHSMLAGKVVSEACYSTNNPTFNDVSLCPGGVSSSTANNSALPCPVDCDHGTHVAGTVAGNSVTTSGQTLAGVARGGNLIAIQVFTKSTGTGCCASCAPTVTCYFAYTSDIVSGLNRVYELRNTYSIAAANLSLGGGAYSSEASCDSANFSSKTAIDLLRAANIATVIASGNEGQTGAISTPGCISTAVSVGATSDTSTAIASFSNAASFLKLLAPGVSITSATPGGTYGTWNGTSMAAPHVAGGWAVLRHAAPMATVTEILNALRTTGEILTDARNGLTFPRIRIFNALQSLAVLTTPPPAPSGLTATAFSSTQINVSWTDNATNENSFKLERKLGAGAWSVRATLDANVTVFADTELAAGTYTYRVSAENSFGASTTSNEASATTLAAPGAGTARESLTQNRTYFVSSSGSDSNNGLTSGASFATLQKAFDLIESTLDLKGSTVMIKAAAGTYTSGILIRNWTGGGEIILDLGGGTIHVTGGNAIATSGVLGGTVRVQNGTLRTTTGGNAIGHGAAGALIIDSGINFGPTAGNQINIASPGSLITVASSYTISGGAASHIAVNGSGTIFRHLRGTVTLNGGGGTIAFTNVFANAAYGGFIYSGASYAIVNGSVTGRRYQSFLNSIIETTRGAEHFPGTIAGIAVIGGQYR